MHFLIGKAELFIPYSSSLKEKRKIIKSIIDKSRKRFNISIREVDFQDKWQHALLGFAAVGDSESFLLNMSQSLQLSLDGYEMEVIRFEFDLEKME